MSDGRKFGEDRVTSMMALGFREAGNAFNPSRESIADTGIGINGNRSPDRVELQQVDQVPNRQASGPELER
jgi:hypothetical protein